MVLASLIIAGILVVMFGEAPDILRRKIVIDILFPEAPGVTPKTPIRKSGILIGRVTHVELERRGVRVTAEIDADKRPFKNEICRITPSLLGDAQLNFIRPIGEELAKELVKDGDQLQGVVSRDPIQVIGDLQGNLAEAINSVANTSEEMGRLIRQFGDLFERNEERINTIIAKAEGSMDVFQETLQNANELMADPQVKEAFKDVARQLPQLLQETRETIGRVNQTVASADRNLQNIEGFTRPLGQRGQYVVAELEQGAEKLNRLMNEMLMFSEALNSQQGSLGQLINNPDLYQNLNQAANNMAELTRQLRPIVTDARTFSDKIARHPELLGVRGAIQRSPGTKGVPSFLPRR